MKEIVKEPDLVFCPHQEKVESYCTKCSGYICKKCLLDYHYDHIESVNGLDNVFTDAIKDYTEMNSVLDKLFAKSANNFKDGALDETLLNVEKRISEEYEKLAKDIKDIEADHIAKIEGTNMINRLQSDKEELGGEDIKKLAEFDKKLGQTISQLLSALTSDKPESVQHLIDPKAKENFAKEAQQFEPYYEKQRQFLKKIEDIKGVKPTIIYNAQTIDNLVQIKGVHEEIIKLLIYDSTSHSVFVEFPKDKIMIKYDIGSNKLPKSQAQCIIEDQILFICGGRKKPKSFFKSAYTYSDIEKKLLAKADMTEERVYQGIACKKGVEIYVAGGENSKGILKTAELYDIKSNEWKKMPELSEAKKNISLCMFGDKYLYSIGGISIPDKEISTIEMLNTNEAKAWEIKQVQGGIEIQKAGTIQISDNQIIIFGGKKESVKQNMCYIYDLTNGIIANSQSNLTLPSCFNNRSDTRKIDGIVYSTGNKKGYTYMYDIKMNQWSLIQDKEYTIKYNWD